MAFDVGSIVGHAILNTKQWMAGINTITNSSKQAGGVMQKLGSMAKVAGAALLGVFTASIVKANEFAKSFANVTTLVDTSTVNIEAMRNELLALDSRLGSAKELSEGLYQALSASVEPAKAVQFVGEAAKFAKAALVDTNTAVDVITTGLNAYGLSADYATKVSDQLFSVIKLGKTTGAELSAVIGQSIPLAANMAIGFEELGASIAIMTRQGINASEATTQFNAVVNSFLKPSKKMQQALKSIGYTSGSAAIEALGFKGALDAVTKSAGGSKDELAAIFENTRALRGALALTGEGAKDYSNVLDEITNSGGAANEAFNKQEITFDTLSNTVERLFITIGDKLLPVVYDIVQGIIAFTEELTSNEEIMQAVEDIGKFLGATLKELGKIIVPVIGFIVDLAKAGANLLNDILFPMPPALKAQMEAEKELNKQLWEHRNATKGLVSSLSERLQAQLQITEETRRQTEAELLLQAAFLKQGGPFAAKLTIEAEQKLADLRAKWADERKQDSTQFIKEKTKEIEAVKGLFDEVGSLGNRLSAVSQQVDSVGTVMVNKYKDHLEKLKANHNQAIEAMKQKNNSFQQSFDKMIEWFKNNWDSVLTKLSGVFQSFNNNRIAELDQQLAKNEETLKELEEKRKEALENENMALVAQLDKQIADQKAADEKLKAEKKKLLEANRNAAAFSALVSGSAAVISSFANMGGWPWGLIPAGIMAGIVAAEVAAILTAPLPALSTGGIGKGPTLVGEEGPELVNFGSPSRVFSNEETNKMLGGNINMNINFSGPINSEVDIERSMRLAGKRLQNLTRGL